MSSITSHSSSLLTSPELSSTFCKYSWSIYFLPFLKSPFKVSYHFPFSFAALMLLHLCCLCHISLQEANNVIFFTPYNPSHTISSAQIQEGQQINTSCEISILSSTLNYTRRSNALNIRVKKKNT